jgi:hypothetical protein
VKLLIAATVMSAICLSSLAQEPGAKAGGSEYQKSVVASKQVDTDQANQNDQHLMDEAHTLGLNRIEHDLPTPEENDRLKDEMRRSSYMQILMLNGNNFFQNLSPDLNAFKARHETHMQILVANPDSEFYREETNMVYKQKDIALPPNKTKVNEAVLRLHDGGPDDQRVDIKYYDTQFRLSMVILDSQSCYLTIRLSPHEPMDSIRLEFAGGKENAGFASHCVDHFNKLWGASTEQPGENDKWSLQQKLAVLAAITALLAAIAAFMTALFKGPEFIQTIPGSAKVLRRMVIAPWRRMVHRGSSDQHHKVSTVESEKPLPREDQSDHGT